MNKVRQLGLVLMLMLGLTLTPTFAITASAQQASALLSMAAPCAAGQQPTQEVPCEVPTADPTNLDEVISRATPNWGAMQWALKPVTILLGILIPIFAIGGFIIAAIYLVKALFSAGNSEKVKESLKAAGIGLIGMVIGLGAWFWQDVYDFVYNLGV